MARHCAPGQSSRRALQPSVSIGPTSKSITTSAPDTYRRRRRYRPSIGGHAPGHLRDAFVEAVEQHMDRCPGDPAPMAEIDDAPVPLTALCGLL